MNKQTIQFAVQTTQSGMIQNIGRSYILQPKVRYSGREMKWYEDKLKNNSSVHGKRTIA